MERILKIFMLFLLCFSVGNAQENAKNHKVRRGETIIEIAKLYNVTPYDIQQANLNTLISLDEIKENDVLVIPKSKIITPPMQSASDAIKSSISTRSLTYTVKKGDTKYGLSKRFGVTISDLEIFNPQIVVGLNEGHVLKINRHSQNLSEESRPEAQTATRSTLDGYKKHLVLKGETLYGISKANGMTVEQLVRINSDVLSGVLKEGQTLKVPKIQNESSTSLKKYTVSKGETKYGLSKKFLTSIETLERLNPHIIKMLQAGHVINIPSDNTVAANTWSMPTVGEKSSISNPTDISETTETVITTETEKTALRNEIAKTPDSPQPNRELVSSIPKYKGESMTRATQNILPVTYDSYEIKPKETLFSLSKKAGMSIPDFVALNPKLKESVQIGTIIKMPSKAVGISKENTQTTPQVTEQSIRYKDLSKTIQTLTDKKLLFVLPFTEEAFQKETSDHKSYDLIADTFIKNHLEFYSGSKLALDSIKKLGLKVQVQVLEIEKDKSDTNVTNILKDSNIANYDALMLPFYETMNKGIAEVITNQNIPVITAANIAPQQNTNNFFSALPSINQQRRKILDYIVSKQGNIIVISDANRSESKDFISKYIPYAKFVDVKKNGSFKEDDLLEMMNSAKLNFVILDSERNSVFLNVTNLLLSELNTYNLQLAVLESSLIPNSDDVSIKRLRILKMLFPSLTPANANTDLETFSKKYKSVYDRQPTNNALIGFDITFDTLLRLLQQSGFEESAKNDVTEYVKLKFNYQSNSLGGYSNEGIYILQHHTDLDLLEVN